MYPTHKGFWVTHGSRSLNWRNSFFSETFSFWNDPSCKSLLLKSNLPEGTFTRLHSLDRVSGEHNVQQAEQDRSKVALAGLDAMLGDSELRDVKTAFWQRYKLRFPSVVSRVSRELAKRMLACLTYGRSRISSFSSPLFRRSARRTIRRKRNPRSWFPRMLTPTSISSTR